MVLVVFVALALIGQAVNVAFCLLLDNLISPTVGVLTFVLLYVLVFAGTWLLAVRIVEGWEGKAEAPRPSGARPIARRPTLQTSAR